MSKTFEKITNIRQVRIGDIIRREGNGDELYVVGIYTDPGTLGFQPADKTGIIYADFEDNPGDVLEFDLRGWMLERLVM